jgi:carboxymethylenebutenolidase
MDLRSYIESEVEEEKGLPRSSAAAVGDAGTPTGGYPGDPDVHVSDADLAVERARTPGPHGEQAVYIARPREGQRAPAVLVIHENKGLVPYIENVARRLAALGYVAVAPDLLSRVGGTGAYETPGDATAALSAIDGDDIVADVRAVLAWVAERDYVAPDRLAILGFCYGGGVAWRVLTEEPRLTTGVPFYGPIPEVDAVPGIQAPVMAVYGELDQRITSMLPTITAAMAEQGKTFEPVVLEGAGHAFHNDTNPDRYDPEAARTAWDAAVGWLDRWLKTG